MGDGISASDQDWVTGNGFYGNMEVQDEWGERGHSISWYRNPKQNQSNAGICKHWNILADKQTKHNTYQAGYWNTSSIILVSLLTEVFFFSILSVVILGWGQWWQLTKTKITSVRWKQLWKSVKILFFFQGQFMLISRWNRLRFPRKFQFFLPLLFLSALHCLSQIFKSIISVASFLPSTWSPVIE